jgi:hypothetical protein
MTMLDRWLMRLTMVSATLCFLAVATWAASETCMNWPVRDLIKAISPSPPPPGS